MWYRVVIVAIIIIREQSASIIASFRPMLDDVHPSHDDYEDFFFRHVHTSLSDSVNISIAEQNNFNDELPGDRFDNPMYINLGNETDIENNNSNITQLDDSDLRVNNTGLQNDNVDLRANTTRSRRSWRDKWKSWNKMPIRYENARRLCPNGTICPSKCCKLGENFDLVNNRCSRTGHYEFVPPVWEEHTKLSDSYVRKIFTKYLTGNELPCLKDLHEEKKLVTDITKVFRLRSDGNLEVESPLAIGPEVTYRTNKYCIDMFIMAPNKTKLNAFICHIDDRMKKYHLAVTSSCYLVTCFFIILRVSVFAWLPELRTLHGVIIMAYLVNFVVGYMLLGIKELFMWDNNINREICISIHVIIYFSIMSAFFWRNIMCFDMWSTFSGKRIITRKSTISRLRLSSYFAYAFGVPAGLTSLLLAMEFSKISRFHPLKPKLRINGCAPINGIGMLVYYFIPLITLFFANAMMFISTALNIAAIKKQTKMLYQSKDSVVVALNVEKQRFLLNLKLWAAMLILEVNWIVKAVAYFFPEMELLIIIVDVYNAFVLLIIILQYFSQKSTWKIIKKRYQQMRGIAVSEPNTVTSSNRTISTSSAGGSQTDCTTITSNYETSTQICTKC